MATYLLLRDNKNSGPYTLEALLQLGLKPYDLVWVEGKSAAWRYPSEVDDLKFYAPVVEEQPYDRFYKKPSDKVETEKKQVVKQEIKPVQQEVNYSIPEEEVKQSAKITEIKAPKKQVFVSLPANQGNTTFIKKTEQVAASANPQSVNELYNNNTTPLKTTVKVESPSYAELVSEYNNYQPREKKIFIEEDEMPVAKKEAPVETKYSQSLDDIKDIYVQTLADRKKKNAQKKMIMMVVKRGLPFAAVLVIGFMMGGFMMNRKSNAVTATQPLQNNLDKIVVKKEEKTEPQPQTVLPQQQITGAENISPETNDAASLKSQENPKQLKLDKNSTAQLPLNVVKKFVAKQNEAAKTTPDNTAVLTQKPQNIEADPKTGERNKVTRADNENNTDKNNPVTSSVKNGLLKQVNVKGNDYKVGTFGGIHDLQLTVVNNSNFLLDRVMVELQYLKPSEQTVKTSNVQFDNVPPNGSLTLAIPATNRGIKVVYKVINVQSKAAGNDTAGL